MPRYWIDTILERCAHLADVSDLALEPLDDGSVAARVRQSGIYHQLEHTTDGAAAVARLKALAGVPAYIVDEPQDGRIDGTPFGFDGDLRAAFLPTVRGVRAAIRVPTMSAVPRLEALGLPDDVQHGLATTIAQPQGLLLVCGPTGSGKTTTMHALLAQLVRQRPDRLPLAIEDPVERRLDGVVQVEVAAHRNFDFGDALRAGLRHDPDVIVIGEVRDPATAMAACRAALTGHLVITSLHCARARDALPRLIEMGVPDELLLPTVRAVLAQRLVRLRHAACDGHGCADCLDGFAGRQAVADWIALDHEERRTWIAGNVPSLAADMDRQAAALLMAERSSADEIDRVLGSTP